MKEVLVLSALCIWGMQLIPVYWLRILFAALCGLFFLLRFRSLKPFGLFALCACLFLFHPFVLQDHTSNPRPGLFRVVQVRKSYVIAENEHKEKAVVYEAQDLAFGDQLELEEFERIHSLKNESLFCFEDYLNQKGIYYSAVSFRPESVVPSKTLQARLYRAIQDHPQAEVLRLFLYSLSGDDVQPFFLKLGFGLCAFGALLRSILQRWLTLEQSSLLCAVLLGAAGFLLTWNLALFRMVIFFLARAILPKWEKRWSLQILVFLWFVPYGAAEFGFVLPVLISLVQRMEPGFLMKKALNLCLLCGMQILYFRSLSFFSLIGFGWMRRLWAACFVLALVQLFIPFPLGLSAFLETGLPSLMEVSLHGEFVWWMSLLFFFSLFRVLLSRKKNRALLLFATLLLYPVSLNLDPFFHVYILDIGQGDCSIIRTPFNRQTIMIDAAGHLSRDNASEIIIPFLQAKGIQKIDTLIVTHNDLDHAGAVPSLTDQFCVEQVITPDNTQEKTDFPLEFLLTQREAADENDRSVVTHFAYDGFTWLFPGDASSEIELQLLKQYDLQADILKLGHHGSSTSSDPRFLKALQPTIGIVSAGYQNRYGHPSLETLIHTDQQGINVLDTPSMGSIHFFSLKNHLFVQSARGYVSHIPRSGMHSQRVTEPAAEISP